jgi:hypothetical protein
MSSAKVKKIKNRPKREKKAVRMIDADDAIQ